MSVKDYFSRGGYRVGGEHKQTDKQPLRHAEREIARWADLWGRTTWPSSFPFTDQVVGGGQWDMSPQHDITLVAYVAFLQLLFLSFITWYFSTYPQILVCNDATFKHNEMTVIIMFRDGLYSPG